MRRGQRQVGVGVVLAHRPEDVERRQPGPVGPRHRRSAGAASSRSPRAQSAAGICFLPNALTSPSRTGSVPVPTSTSRLPIRSSPGASPSASGTGRTGPILIRSPSCVDHAPGAGVHARILRSTATDGSLQSTSASSTPILGAKLTPSACCSRASSEPSAIPSRVATSRPGAALGQPGQQVAGGVVGPDPLGHHAVRRPGVELLDDPERGRAGHLVAGPDGVLHRRRSPPRRQAREVQVDPAVLGDVQRRLGQQRAVGDHRAGVGPLGRAAPPGTPARADGPA